MTYGGVGNAIEVLRKREALLGKVPVRPSSSEGESSALESLRPLNC
jgi:hypothetical protein